MKWRNSGFTLVELTIVMVVLGILASVAVPSFMRALNASRLSYSVQLAETALGKAFSQARSEAKDFTVQGWEGSRSMMISSGNSQSDPCTSETNGCQFLDRGVKWKENFTVTFSAPYGDIIKQEGNTELTIIGSDKQQKITIHQESGLIETHAPRAITNEPPS